MAITYSIDGGADAAKFNINATSGALTFKTAPDFEAPGDANADNVYEVSVKATDAGGAASSKLVKVTVTDVSENAPPQITSAGAISMKENSTTVMTITATDPDDTTTPPVEPPVEPPTTGGGTYDNLKNWPGADNRPSISGSTLTWTGPTGGGPSTASDKQQTRTLTARNGNVSSASNGQIIEGLDIAGVLSVKHTGVTVRQCRIRSNGAFTTFEANGNSGVVVEDCIISNNGGTQQNGINIGWGSTMSGPQAVLRRCNVFGYENHFPSQQNCLVIDNWFHGAVGADCDMIELYGNAPNGGSKGIVVRHNTFDGRDTKAGSFLNAGINVTNDFGSTQDHTFDNNAFIKIGSAHDICDDKSHGTGTCSFAATNNGFYQSGGYRRDAVTCSPNSGNFVMATLTATSGELCNGTGVL